MKLSTGTARSLILFTLPLAIAACADPPTRSPEDAGIRAAKGGGGIQVTSADPDEMLYDTTEEITIGGSGFSDGDVAVFVSSVDGTELTTNSTTVNSSTEISANVTASALATPGFYNVEVRPPRGRKGIGIDLLEVACPPEDTRPACAGGGGVKSALVDVGGAGDTGPVTGDEARFTREADNKKKLNVHAGSGSTQGADVVIDFDTNSCGSSLAVPSSNRVVMVIDRRKPSSSSLTLKWNGNEESVAITGATVTETPAFSSQPTDATFTFTGGTATVKRFGVVTEVFTISTDLSCVIVVDVSPNS